MDLVVSSHGQAGIRQNGWPPAFLLPSEHQSRRNGLKHSSQEEKRRTRKYEARS